MKSLSHIRQVRVWILELQGDSTFGPAKLGKPTVYFCISDIHLNRCDPVTKLSRRYIGVGGGVTILGVWQRRAISNNERL